MRPPVEGNPDAIQESIRLRRSAWAGLLVLIAVGILLYAWSRISTNKLISEANRALDEGRIEDAEGSIVKFMRTREETAEASFLSARLAFAKRQPEEVLKLLAKAREKGYDDLPMERLLGLVFAASGRDAEAETRLLRSWESDGKPDSEVADALCKIYFNTYRFAPALRVAQEWARRKPQDIRPLLWKAEIRTWDDSSAEAQIAEFDAVLAREPDQFRSRLNRAGALFRVGRLAESKRDYDLYIRAKPDDPDGFLGAAKTAEGLDDEDTALAHYDRVLALDPKNVVGLKSKAAILIHRKKYADALPLLDLAMAGAPNDPEPHYRKSRALEGMGKADEAKAEYTTRERLRAEQEEYERIRKGLVRNPSDVKLMSLAASWLLGHGYEKEGLDWADKTLAKEPHHLATIRLLAAHFAKSGDVGKANFYRLMLPPGS